MHSPSSKDVLLCTVDHNSSYWFPCVQSYNELCTWKIEVVVNENKTVITSGNLIEIEEISETQMYESNNDTDGSKSSNLKKYHYFLQVPTCAPNIGLIVGEFESLIDENMAEISYYYPEYMLKDILINTISFENEILDFYEEMLSVHFPHNVYKQVFIHDLPDDFISFSTLTILR